MKCEDCKWARQTVIVGGHTGYECRRHAPGFPPSQNRSQQEADRIFPVVYPSDWCGDHEKATPEQMKARFL